MFPGGSLSRYRILVTLIVTAFALLLPSGKANAQATCGRTIRANVVDPNRADDDQPATRTASVHVQGL
jgi:hypothetical protein